jgi:hypothetical protein
MKETIEEYIRLREEIDGVKARLKALEEQKKSVETVLIEFLDANPIGSLEGEGGEKLYRGTRRYAKVVDERSLEEWAETEGIALIEEKWTELQRLYNVKNVEPEIFIQKPNNRLLNVLLKYYADMAERNDEFLSDLLPQGLEQSITEYISMRKPSTSSKRHISIIEMAKEGAKNVR